MCDPISLASAAATWAVNKLLDRLSSAAITALLGSEGLDKEVALLRDALRRANLVLGAVPAGAAAGVRIGNQQLVPQIDEMQRLAADLAKYLDELEYYKIKEKVHPIFPPSVRRRVLQERRGQGELIFWCPVPISCFRSARTFSPPFFRWPPETKLETKKLKAFGNRRPSA
jgi:hypothetical protein